MRREGGGCARSGDMHRGTDSRGFQNETGMLAKTEDWLPGLQYAAAGLVNAVTGIMSSRALAKPRSVSYFETDLLIEREHSRVPVKLPGWSQPGVSGWQAWTATMAKTKEMRREVYMTGKSRV